MTDAPLAPVVPQQSSPRFSPSDAVFAAFERRRVPPRRFWAILTLFTLATLLIYAPWLYFAHRDLRSGLIPLAPQYGYGMTQATLTLAGLLLWPAAAFVETGFLRAMLPRTGKSFLHDALLVVVTYVVTVILTYALLVVAIIVAALAGGFVAAAIGAVAQDGVAAGALSAAMVTLIVCLCALAAVAPLYFWLRLSLAPAMTVAEGRLRIFESWPVTRRRVAGLLGAHLLRIVLLLVAYFALFIVFALIGFILIGGDLLPAWELLMAGEPLPPRVLTIGAILTVFTLLPGCVLAVVNCAMSAGIGASLLQAARPVAPGPDSR